jgi:hypothetical protein
MAKTGIYQPIETLLGTQPTTDMTAAKTQHYTYSDKIRYKDGTPEKIGGWASIIFDYSATVAGYIRTIFTEIINGRPYTMLGSNEKLYALIGSRLTNITPFLTTSEAVANSLSTHYATLANNPLTTTNGSKTVVVADTEAAFFELGDIYTLAGSAAVAGIPDTDINGDHIVRAIGVNTISIAVATAANASTTGGGAAVVRSSGLITVAAVAHGQEDGDRVKIEDAAAAGGIADTAINVEHIIRNVVADSFDIMTDDTATSAVTAAGGANTIYYEEIPIGLVNETNAQGYGAGLYGMGLYGTALISDTIRQFPRVWYMDRYANTILMTPGNQTPVYQWDGDTNFSPVEVTNAPDEINYAFVSNNILVTFGASDMGSEVENRIFASDINDIEEWTSSSTNQVFDDDIEGAGRLLCHLPLDEYNLIFTENQTYRFRYIGLPFVWEIKQVDNNIGIISSMAGISVKGVGYWMGLENFYMFRGGNVEIIRANSQDESTALKYVFGDLNWGQKSQIFAWDNRGNNEIWFHYPSANSLEPDRAVVVNISDFTWAIHTLDRTAAERPSIKLKNPRLAEIGDLYQHEFGTDADGEPLPFTLTSNRRYYGRDNVNLNAVIPDSSQTGDITFTNVGYLFPQSSVPISTNAFTVTPTTERIPVVASARFHEYTWEGSALGQDWMMGGWIEEVQKGSTE